MPLSPKSALIPISVATCLSLLGDSTLYTVLPIHTAAAGITLASVGILLSANRFIRLLLNTPIGYLYTRWPRRRLFNLSLLMGVVASFVYASTSGFWPLLAGRLLWGLAWVGIWIGGNTIILDVSDETNRGRLVGSYQAAFFLGAAGGAVLGGILTDALGYHQAMAINGLLALAGLIYSVFALPETRPGPQEQAANTVDEPILEPSTSSRGRTLEFASANILNGMNRLAVAGVVSASFALLLQLSFGDQVAIAGNEFGITTIAGLSLGLSTLVAMGSVQFVGRLSDRSRVRWSVVSWGLIPGIIGFLLLARAGPLIYVPGLFLIAFTSGSNTGLSTTLVGDLSPQGRQGSRLGVLYTVGDLGSAVGPMLTFALLPLIALEGVYLLMAMGFGLLLIVAVLWALKKSHLRIA